MNRDDIIRMAREVWGDTSDKPWSDAALLHLERFAALIAAAEREACAQVVTGMADKYAARSGKPGGITPEIAYIAILTCEEVRMAIRERGQE